MSPTTQRLQRLIISISWGWALLLVLAPLLYVLVVSFMQKGAYGGIEMPLGLQAYRQMLDPLLRTSLLDTLLRSLLLALTTTLGCLVLALPLVLYLVLKARRLRTFLFFLLIIPFWTNFLIRTYAWQVILSDQGWLNHLLTQLHLPTVAWLFTGKALVLGMLYNYLPFMAMSLYVSMEKIDPLLLDAARDLGANRMQRLTKVILPLLKPGIVNGCTMVFIPALGEFVIPDILGGGTKVYLGNYPAQQFLVVRNWPYGAALSMVLLIMIVATMWLTRHWRSKDQEVLS